MLNLNLMQAHFFLAVRADFEAPDLGLCEVC